MDWENLKEYIGDENDASDEFIESCYSTATALVDLALVNAFRDVPESVLDRMYLEVGNELYKRKDAPSGASQFAVFEGGTLPVRGPRDPLAQVRPIIAMFVVPL